MTHCSRRPILYLLAIEDAVRSPLLRSQVYNLLKKLRETEENRQVICVSLYPIINWWRYRRQREKLRNTLRKDGIVLKILPILFLTRHFYIPFYLLPLFYVQGLAAAVYMSILIKPSLVHCRSYPAALVGKWLNALGGANLVFDTRALYPEEGATLEEGGKTLVLDTFSFKVWKLLERSLMADFHRITVVSQPNAEIIQRSYPRTRDKLRILPTITTTHSPGELNKWRGKIRRKLGVGEKQVIVYSGSWFEPGPMMALFTRLLQVFPGGNLHFLLLVAPSIMSEDVEVNTQVQQAITQGLNMDPGCCTAISVPQPRVMHYLTAADLAVQPVGIPKQKEIDPRYILTAKTRLSIKFTEYLAAGLPVAVSQWAGAAARIARQEDLGFVYEAMDNDQLRDWLTTWRQNQRIYRQRAQRYAITAFDLDQVAAQYRVMYQELLEGHAE